MIKSGSRRSAQPTPRKQVTSMKFNKTLGFDNGLGESISKYVSNCPSLLQTLRNTLVLTANPLQTESKENGRPVQNESGVQLSDKMSCRIFNQILKTPETYTSVERPPIKRLSNLKPFDCSEIKRNLNCGSIIMIQDSRYSSPETTPPNTKSQPKEEAVAKLDEIEVAIELIQRRYPEYFSIWQTESSQYSALESLVGQSASVKAQITELESQQALTKDSIFQRSLVFAQSVAHTDINLPKAEMQEPGRSVAGRDRCAAEFVHTPQSREYSAVRCMEMLEELRQKLGPKGAGLIDNVLLNMKVLLPASITASNTMVLFTKLIQFKLSRKLAPLLKKQFANLKEKDAQALKHFLKTINDQERKYHGTAGPLTVRKASSSMAKLKLEAGGCTQFNKEVLALVTQFQFLQRHKVQKQTKLQQLNDQIAELRKTVTEYDQKIQALVQSEADAMAQEYYSVSGVSKDFKALVFSNMNAERQHYQALLKQKRELEFRLANP